MSLLRIFHRHWGGRGHGMVMGESSLTNVLSSSRRTSPGAKRSVSWFLRSTPSTPACISITSKAGSTCPGTSHVIKGSLTAAWCLWTCSTPPALAKTKKQIPRSKMHRYHLKGVLRSRAASPICSTWQRAHRNSNSGPWWPHLQY